ncbi:hypothetical protein GJ496_011699 [Pomphorhynchus laevis]|nr:hypothetical protein GJ496_011699 [Pomphorhynchus laevis]
MLSKLMIQLSIASCILWCAIQGTVRYFQMDQNTMKNQAVDYIAFENSAITIPVTRRFKEVQENVLKSGNRFYPYWELKCGISKPITIAQHFYKNKLFEMNTNGDLQIHHTISAYAQCLFILGLEDNDGNQKRSIEIYRLSIIRDNTSKCSVASEFRNNILIIDQNHNSDTLICKLQLYSSAVEMLNNFDTISISPQTWKLENMEEMSFVSLTEIRRYAHVIQFIDPIEIEQTVVAGVNVEKRYIDNFRLDLQRKHFQPNPKAVCYINSSNLLASNDVINHKRTLCEIPIQKQSAIRQIPNKVETYIALNNENIKIHCPFECVPACVYTFEIDHIVRLTESRINFFIFNIPGNATIGKYLHVKCTASDNTTTLESTMSILISDKYPEANSSVISRKRTIFHYVLFVLCILLVLCLCIMCCCCAERNDKVNRLIKQGNLNADQNEIDDHQVPMAIHDSHFDDLISGHINIPIASYEDDHQVPNRASKNYSTSGNSRDSLRTVCIHNSTCPHSKRSLGLK